ncbi:hypothetical protein ACFL33_01240 [Pseudomonadota bacterium]
MALILRRLVLIPVALVAVAVLSLAWPRFQASVRYLPVERAIKAYYKTGEIPTDRLPVLIRFASEAIAHQEHYRFHDGLSTLHVLRAMDYKTPALERRDAYVSAMTEAEQSLQQAPANPATWLRLASVRWILHEEPETIVDAWKMSVFTGRIHPLLFQKRAEIGLAYHGYMDEEGKAMLRDQLLLAWRLRPSQLMQVVAKRDPDLRVSRRLLAASDPMALSEMEAWLEKRRR